MMPGLKRGRRDLTQRGVPRLPVAPYVVPVCQAITREGMSEERYEPSLSKP